MRKLALESISHLKESQENSYLYDPPSNSEIEQLARSIKTRGLLDPVIITKDRYIISGHRRIAACRLLGKESVRCKVLPITYRKNRKRFIKLLREANRQRVKKVNEFIQEGLVDTSDKGTTENLIIERIRRSLVDIESFEIMGRKKRFQIKGNRPILDGAIKVIDELRDYWPLSDRAIHYKLLNNPPGWDRRVKGVMNHFVYRNDGPSYKKLTDVLTRGRLTGEIPWEAIGDETRPFVSWNVYNNTSVFIKEQFYHFMKNYHRNFLQSQANWIEIMAEKLTLESIIRPIAMKYHIPYAIGRGYSSINPRHDLAVRFEKSGKMKLICLILSDLDPDGDEIAQSFARSMRDDFSIRNIYPIKVALTWDQVKALNLPASPDRKAKTGSKNYNKYVERYGSDDIWELEALSPQQLQKFLDEAVRGVIKTDLFNQEMQNEKSERVELDEYRSRLFKSIQTERS